MSFLRKLFGRAERPAADPTEARRAIEEGAFDVAIDRAREGLLMSPSDPELLRVMADALLRAGRGDEATLFARAADAPDDPSRMAELGSQLLTREAPHLACAFLALALDHAPLDVIVRSELAIAQARSGQPAQAVQTLALHPCLGEDPGALFELAWASLLSGDLDTAHGARDELARARGAPSLLDKLDCALARSAVAPASDPPDARDYLFLEHGSMLLAQGPHRGRHGEVALDAAQLTSILASAASVVRELHARPRRLIAASDEAGAIARALADAADGEVIVPNPRGSLPSAILVALRAEDLLPHAARLRAAPGDVLSLALVLDYRRSLAHTPDLVGILARAASLPSLLPGAIADAAPDPTLAPFITPRLPHLPPRGRRVPSAYVPDAPLPWP